MTFFIQKSLLFLIAGLLYPFYWHFITPHAESQLTSNRILFDWRRKEPQNVYQVISQPFLSFFGKLSKKSAITLGAFFHPLKIRKNSIFLCEYYSPNSNTIPLFFHTTHDNKTRCRKSLFLYSVLITPPKRQRQNALNIYNLVFASSSSGSSHTDSNDLVIRAFILPFSSHSVRVAAFPIVVPLRTPLREEKKFRPRQKFYRFL